ncbi:hypothetical protein LOK49_LG12G00592 [Camellia lanceoleosa]|uniref:Uncharacterized protein n=1 Tax=Camellia lanceoleosa TaxID=1840588 RepID=A0ACC0FWL7_9ERIC|nr:hypothetical protein LOK49_LG12G00592 [Camellia lanceoleosa]
MLPFPRNSFLDLNNVHVVEFAPGPFPAADGNDGGVELQWNYGLEPTKKKIKEQDFLENNSQMCSVDFLQARSVSTGLGLSFDNGRLASSGDSSFLGVMGDEIDCELQRQDAEIDRLLKIQVWTSSEQGFWYGSGDRRLQIVSGKSFSGANQTYMPRSPADLPRVNGTSQSSASTAAPASKPWGFNDQEMKRR